MTQITRVGQGQVDAYVLGLLSRNPDFDIDQVTGFTMIDLNLPYDEAKPMVKLALLNLHKEEKCV